MSDSFLVNVQDGTVDIRTMEFQWIDPADRAIPTTGIKYDAAAPRQEWEAFLLKIFGGDSELISFYKRAAGYSITGSTKEQCLFMCYGQSCSGKSTAINAMGETAGGYAKNTHMDFMLGKDGEKVLNDLARLNHCRIATGIGPKKRGGLGTVEIFKFTGNDPVMAKPLYRDYFQFDFMAKLWMLYNEQPKAEDKYSSLSRVYVIPFKERIRNIDRDMPDKLRIERQGILAWMLEGAHEWHSEGLAAPAAVRAATDACRSKPAAEARL